MLTDSKHTQLKLHFTQSYVRMMVEFIVIKTMNSDDYLQTECTCKWRIVILNVNKETDKIEFQKVTESEAKSFNCQCPINAELAKNVSDKSQLLEGAHVGHSKIDTPYNTLDLSALRIFEGSHDIVTHTLEGKSMCQNWEGTKFDFDLGAAPPDQDGSVYD